MPELAAIRDETWTLLELPSTATLATVLAKQGLWNTFITGARPLAPERRLVGQAFTLRYIPAREDLDHNLVFDNLTDPQRLAVERVGPRDVLVIDARGDERSGTMGNILAERIKARGAAGVVTDGCFRDSPAIAAAGIAAYARSAHAATNKTVHHPVDLQVPIGCGGVAVYPGDILVGDAEGVVVLPRHLAADVARQAARQEHRVLVRSRTATAIDLLAGTCGIWAGAWLTHRWQRRPGVFRVPDEDSHLWTTLKWLAGAGAYVVLLCALLWWPLEAETDHPEIRARAAAFLRVPFATLYCVDRFEAMGGTFRKLLLFAPLGGMLAHVVLRYRVSASARRLVLAGVVIACGALGIMIELVQAFFPPHVPDLTDVILYTAGAWSGTAILTRLQQLDRNSPLLALPGQSGRSDKRDGD